MINQVEVSEDRIDRILGKGYKDTEIINRSVKRIYNTTAIQKVIKENNGIKVYSTWGKGSNLKEWKRENSEIGRINYTCISKLGCSGS